MSAYENAPKAEQKDDDVDTPADEGAIPTEEIKEDNRDKYERLARLHNITQPDSRAAQ